MWDHWKQKIKSLFAESEIEEQQEENHKTEKSNLEAKMMYQYPTNKSFRFPVIPDQAEQRKENTRKKNRNSVKTNNHNFMNNNLNEDRSSRIEPEQQQQSSVRLEKKNMENSEELPAYQRKRSRRSNSDRSTYHTSHSLSQEEGRNVEREQSANKVYKKDPDVPFKPTEVPSPIYGFRPRDEQKAKVENIPAYQRKVDEKNKEPFSSEINQEIRKESVEIAEREIAAETKEEEKVSELLHEENATPASVNISEVKDSSKQQPRKSEETENCSISEDRRRSSKRVNQREHKKQERQSGRATIPFNVMMTPRDKKNLMEKSKKAKRRESEQKSEITKQELFNKKDTSIPYYLLDDIDRTNADDDHWVQQQQQLLEQTLKHFNVRAKVVNATQGPSVTRFEVQPELGVKVSKVKNLSDDLKLNMAARDIRIEAPIPGKNTIGIEIPNRKAQMVGLQGIFETDAFKRNTSPLTIALGLSIEGQPLITNIQKMPHGLIAGATGSGKSVCINTILISLLYKASHEEVKFLLIDPKMVELAPYNGIPHLVSPVITDVKAATAALKWAVTEMEDRYEKFVHEGVRDIERYNQKMDKQQRTQDKLPFIVIVIDELADLMMVSPQDVEDAISRIAQKARACGIHLLLATQRPSVDVITGLIKANIPTRIAFSVSSQVDSRTILDTSGAEKLLGKGDMLFIENGAGKSMRLQGPFVSDEEIERVTNYTRSIAEPNYLFEQEELLEQVAMDEEEDDHLKDAVKFVLEQNGASTSLLQRHFKIGYNRAARLIDSLEQRGIISGQNGSKPREVLVTASQVEEML
ncbi:DNA translocase FtsK [Virgibacillus salexigens]|uniref:Septum-associated FtsK-like translocase of DNA n=1 Tax=Virgibacillus massiliensis TaxID=1462526 RepID=A0A024QAG5_9BACI|nr:DNA translocase FtsK [Virgibacillus massiliensis]CDQ39282.1 Septum-associated FtsK-like translocase of DNA [Virgibacillus massiliensis]